MAAANGGFDVLNQGDDPTHAIQQLTGQTTLLTSGSSNNQTLDAVAAGHPAEATTSGMQSGYYDPETGDFRGSKQVSSHDINLVGDHGYAITGVTGTAPNRTVTLENPWDSGGHSENGSPGDGSFGKFSISEQAFDKMFSWDGYATGQVATAGTAVSTGTGGDGTVHDAVS